MRCQFCGSKSMHKDKERKNFSTGKAVAGAVVFGPVGAAAGFIGKDVEGYRCGMCGNFMETEMDSYTEMQIESAIRSAEIGSSTAMYDYYKRQYPNIENVVKANNTSITERPAMVALTTNGGSTDASVVRETSENIKHAYKNMEWVPNCPVMVDSITIKAIDGKDVLCIRAYNQSNKTLRSIYFHADVFDDTGDKVAEADCVYQGLEVKLGEMLPIEQIFSLNTVVAYRVNLTCQKAAFTDETVWRREVNEKIIVLTPQEEIQKDAFPRYAYVMQQAQNSLKNIAEPIYLPQKEEEYWQCICGSVVGGDNNCPRCGAKYDRLMEMLSQEKLRALQQEAVKKRAKERAKTTETLYENTYSKKYDREYHMAMSLIKNDNVEDLNKAIGILEKISTWKDAGSKINTCRNRIVELGKDKTYQEAVALYNADDKAEIAKAIPIFGQVLDYKDSKQKVDACKEKIAKIEQKEEQERIAAEEAQKAKELAKKKNTKMGIVAVAVAVACVALVMVYSNVIAPNQKYNQALQLIGEKQYDDGLSILEELGNYKDASEQIALGKAKKAVDSIENKENNSYKVKTAFKELLAMEKNNLVKDYILEEADGLIATEEYDYVFEIFESLGDYPGAIEEIEKTKEYIYNRANALQQQGSYREAKELYNRIGGYKDAKVQINYLKYKAIAVNDSIQMGVYEQDGDSSNGKEPINWRVLAVNGEKVLLLSEYILEARQYALESTAVTWETSEIRNWLGESFYEEAFDNAEKSMIQITNNSNDNNSYYGTSGGNATQDKVFLLSENEANRYLLTYSPCSATEATIKNTPNIVKANGYSRWWLRTPGYKTSYVLDVSAIASLNVNQFGAPVTSLDIGVRPAMWVDLTQV